MKKRVTKLIKWGKKRSIIGTSIYVLAILLKVFWIVMAFMIFAQFDWYLDWLDFDSSVYNQSQPTLFIGGVVLGIQVGVLAYSLKHEEWRLGAQDKRPWLKGLIFLWTPIQVIIEFTRDQMYNIIGWELTAQCVLDILIFAGLLTRPGSKFSNYLRPFKEIATVKPDEEVQVEEEEELDEEEAIEGEQQQRVAKKKQERPVLELH